MIKRIFRFAAGEVDGDAGMAALLGGKGANLAEMAALNIPVPPGFTITTDACNDYHAMADGEGALGDRALFMAKLVDEAVAQWSWIADKLGYPPLVSIRSGAPVSMPGMMDTILNVGLCSGTTATWHDRIGERAKLDSYRRLIQMLGSTAYGIDMAKFDFQLASIKKQHKVALDTELDAVALDQLVGRYLNVFKTTVGYDFPDKPGEQLAAAIEAVFRSWMNPRAVEYRRINNIDAGIGTAVTVQAMVFGNAGEDSGTGVLFSREPATGAATVLGEFLPNAQGEDVVAGIRTPLPLKQMAVLWPDQHLELMAVTHRLEQHYRDMMDLEFTIEHGVLWLLQCRVGKRSALAAFKIATQFVAAGLITPDEALGRLTRAQYRLVRRPRIPDSFTVPAHGVGKPASPGVAIGRLVFSAQAAVAAKEPCVLITHETCPDDIAGMYVAQGILTATGGATSHAAVVARGMDKPCIVGCTALELIGSPPHELHVAGADVAADKGTLVSLCGDTGRFWFGIDVPVEDASQDPDVLQVCLWALAREGCSEHVSWPRPGQRRQTLRLADFWGDYPRLAAILKTVVEHGNAAVTILDATPPHGGLLAVDAALAGCFGADPVAAAAWGWLALEKALLEGQPDPGLAGLTVLAPGHEDARDALRAAGCKLAAAPKTLHDLLFAERVALSPEFVREVLGSSLALSELLDVMAKAGRKMDVLERSVALDYATFSVLGC